MKIFFSILWLVFVSGCTTTHYRSLDERIVGVWHLKDYGSGLYEYSQLGISSNGRKCVVSVEFNNDGEPDVSYYDNTWSIKDGVFILIVGDSPSSSLPKGYTIRDHIKRLNDSELYLLMESSSQYIPRLEKHQRLNGVSPERICEIVENYSKTVRNKSIKSDMEVPMIRWKSRLLTD